MSKKLMADDWYRSTVWTDDPAADVDGYVARLGKLAPTSYDLADKLSRWRDQGYVVFERALTIEQVDAADRDIGEVLARHRDYQVAVDGDERISSRYKTLDQVDEETLATAQVKLVGMHEVSKAVAALTCPPVATDFLRHVFGSRPALLQTLAFQRGSQQPIHQDFPYVHYQADLAKLAAFWIPLEDIHADSGPLQYWPGSHRPASLGFFDWGDGAINQFDRNANKQAFSDYESFLNRRVTELGIAPQTFLPRRGDVLVWHGALAHGGSPIRDANRTRRSVVGHFTTTDSHPALARRKIEEGIIFGGATADRVEAYRKSRRAGLKARLRRLLGR